jgi:hypothetical protein
MRPSAELRIFVSPIWHTVRTCFECGSGSSPRLQSAVHPRTHKWPTIQHTTCPVLTHLRHGSRSTRDAARFSQTAFPSNTIDVTIAVTSRLPSSVLDIACLRLNLEGFTSCAAAMGSVIADQGSG